MNFINWWAVLEKVLTGFCWGSGFSLAVILCLVVVPRLAKGMS